MFLSILMRGRPTGSFNHPDELFMEFVSGEPKTPDRIRCEILGKYGKRVSWNTVVKRLDNLVGCGVFKLRMGRFHLYKSTEF